MSTQRGGLPLNPRLTQGAVDLGALAAAREAQAKAEQVAVARQASDLPVIIDVTTATFENAVINQSMSIPVVVNLWAPGFEQCQLLTPVLESLALQFNGRLVLANINVEEHQQFAQAFQAQSLPAVFAAIGGQVMPLFQGPVSESQVRQVFDAVLAQASSMGITGTLGDGSESADKVYSDPRFDKAEAALDAGDWDAARAAYQELLTTTPNDPIARVGLLNVELLARVDGVDYDAALATTDSSLDAQLLIADVLFMCGELAESFAKLTELVRTTSGDERTAARTRLLELFDIAGPQEPSVAPARTALANALF